jgi:adenylylsulfate kinase
MKTQKAKNIVWHTNKITREQREMLLKQKGAVLWITGLSGCGKSTIANELAFKLHKMGKLAYVLDGDNIRHGLNSNLGFSGEDRNENIRRISEVAKLFADSGIIVITAFISPYRNYRNFCRKLVGADRFIEIYAKASIETCEKRDTKGLYKKARAGLIKDFTGVNAPYEEPKNPEIILNTDKETVDESVEKVMQVLKKFKIIGK